jgi:hypothetical protein
MRRLFLHIGAGKTGTSHLQAQLAINHGQLKSVALYYPVWDELLEKVKRGDVTTGNAMHLLPLLCPQHPSVKTRQQTQGEGEEKALRWLRHTLQTNDIRNILISGEAMQHAKAEPLSVLVECAKDKGFTTEVIYYVRHALDHAISDFREHLQRGFRDGDHKPELRTLEGWIANRKVPYQSTLDAYRKVFSDELIHVRSYDAEKKDLWSNFLRVMNIDKASGWKVVDGKTNRSLTAMETEFMQAAAASLSKQQMFKLGMRLISVEPVRVRGKNDNRYKVSEEALEAFRRKHEPIVTEINLRWMDSLPLPIQIIPHDFSTKETTATPAQLLDIAMHALKITL